MSITIKEIICRCIAEELDCEPEELNLKKKLITLVKENTYDDEPDEFGYVQSEYNILDLVDLIKDHFGIAGNNIIDEKLFLTGTLSEIIKTTVEKLESNGIKADDNFLEKKRWSRHTRILTQKRLIDVQNGRMNGYCLKHFKNKYGILSMVNKDNKDNKTFIISIRNSDEKERYGTIEELIENGWVLD